MKIEIHVNNTTIAGLSFDEFNRSGVYDYLENVVKTALNLEKLVKRGMKDLMKLQNFMASYNGDLTAMKANSKALCNAFKNVYPVTNGMLNDQHPLAVAVESSVKTVTGIVEKTIRESKAGTNAKRVEEYFGVAVDEIALVVSMSKSEDNCFGISLLKRMYLRLRYNINIDRSTAADGTVYYTLELPAFVAHYYLASMSYGSEMSYSLSVLFGFAADMTAHLGQNGSVVQTDDLSSAVKAAYATNDNAA